MCVYFKNSKRFLTFEEKFNLCIVVNLIYLNIISAFEIINFIYIGFKFLQTRKIMSLTKRLKSYTIR